MLVLPQNFVKTLKLFYNHLNILEIYTLNHSLYLYNIYNINDYVQLANDILTYLKNGDMMNVMLIFNRILARIPYEDFANDNINKKTIESLNEEQKKSI